MQFLADILDAPVDRPAVMETTALGAAYLAGRAAGLCPDLDGFRRDLAAATGASSRAWTRPTRARKWAGWQDAVRRTLTRRKPLTSVAPPALAPIATRALSA